MTTPVSKEVSWCTMIGRIDSLEKSVKILQEAKKDDVEKPSHPGVKIECDLAGFYPIDVDAGMMDEIARLIWLSNEREPNPGGWDFYKDVNPEWYEHYKSGAVAILRTLLDAGLLKVQSDCPHVDGLPPESLMVMLLCRSKDGSLPRVLSGYRSIRHRPGWFAHTDTARFEVKPIAWMGYPVEYSKIPPDVIKDIENGVEVEQSFKDSYKRIKRQSERWIKIK